MVTMTVDLATTPLDPTDWWTDAQFTREMKRQEGALPAPRKRPDPTPKGVGSAYARRYAKGLKHGDHDQSDHGNWAHGGGDGAVSAVANDTPRGIEGRNALLDALELPKFRALEKGGPETEGVVKHENVERIGTSLVERAKDDPDLNAQLLAVAGRYRETFDARGASTITPYLEVHLGVTKGMSAVEIGAREVAAKLQDTWMATASDSNPLSWGLQLAAAELTGTDRSAADAFFATAGSGDQMGNRPDDYGQSIGLDPVVPLTVGDTEVDKHDVEPGDLPGLQAQAERIADSPAVQAYVAQVYEDTQARLKELGITEVTLYRGVQFANGALSDSETSDGVLLPIDPYNGMVDPGEKSDVVSLNPLTSFSADFETAHDSFGASGDDRNGYVFTTTFPADRIFSLPTSGPGCLNEVEALVLGGPTKAWVETTAQPPVDWGEGVGGVNEVTNEAAYGPGPDAPSDWQDEHGDWHDGPSPFDDEWSAKGKGLKHGDHDQSDHGNWAHGVSSEKTNAGQDGRDALVKVAESARQFDSESLVVREMKSGNVVENASRIVALSEKDPALRAALEARQPYEGKGAHFAETLPPPKTPEGAAAYAKMTNDATYWSQGANGSSNAGNLPMPEDRVLAAAQFWAGTLQSGWAGSASSGVQAQLMQDAAVRVLDAESNVSMKEEFAAVLDRADTRYASFDGVAESLDGVARDFGVELHPGDTYTDVAARYMDQYAPIADAYVQATYDNTQAYLAEKGITEVWLDRGVHFAASQDEAPSWLGPVSATEGGHGLTPGVVGSAIETENNPLSSWTTNTATATMFSHFGGAGGDTIGYRFGANVPADRIFSIPGSGPGCLNEQEVLVISGKDDTAILLQKEFS